MRRSNGYTAIECLVAVAVTLTVVALIVGAIRTYVIRNQVKIGIDTARRWGGVVEMRFHADGRVPRTWNDVGTALEVPTSDYVEELQLVDGRIDIFFGRDAALAIAGQRVSWTPYQTIDQQVVWVCGNDTPGLGLEPLGFADGGIQAVRMPATVATRYLPAGCR